MLLVAAAALAAHLRSLSADLLFDDIDIVRDNASLSVATLRDWLALLQSGYWAGAGRDLLWRPLPLLTYALQRAWGQGALGLHAGNVALHAGASVLLYLFALRSAVGRATALGAALLFAVHPLGSEAVTLVVGRADLLAAAAAFGSLLALRQWRAGAGPALLAAAGASAGLACVSKENGFVLPLLAALTLTCLPSQGESRGAPGSRDRSLRSRWSELALGAGSVSLAALLVLATRLAVLGRVMREGLPPFVNNPIAHAGFWEGRVEAIRLLGRAVRLFLWPHPLSVDYSYAATAVRPMDAVGLVSTAAGLAAAVLVVWLLSRRKVARFGLLFFLGGHLLPLNLLFPIGTAFGERLLYLPMAGLCLTAADLGAVAVGATRRRWIVPASWALLLVALGAMTHLRERDYHSHLALWEATARAQPRSVKAQYNRARSLSEVGDLEAAARGYEAALAIVPDQLESLQNLGWTYLQLQRPGRALPYLDRAATYDPGSPGIAYQHALALAGVGRGEEARVEAARAARLDPNLRATLEKQGLLSPSPPAP